MFSVQQQQQKKTRHTKKQEVWPFKGKRINQQTVHVKSLLADILDKDFKTPIKEVQRTEGRYGESQENDI